MQKVAFVFFTTMLMVGCTPPKSKSKVGAPEPVTGECRAGDTIGFIINGTPAPGEGCRNDGERAQQYIFQQFEVVDNGTPKKGLKRLQPEPIGVDVRLNDLVAIPSGNGCAVEGTWRIYLIPPPDFEGDEKMFLTYKFKTRLVNGRMMGTGSVLREVLSQDETTHLAEPCEEPFELVDEVPESFEAPGPPPPPPPPADTDPSVPATDSPPPQSGFGG